VTDSAAWLFIAGAYGVGALLLAIEVIVLLRRSRWLRRSSDEA